ncbi:MAG: PAS domain S-box protein [Kiritimatiellae bacterium]|nr:PAS domain S-box protein [Kiritimatiellia bacterium]
MDKTAGTATPRPIAWLGQGRVWKRLRGALERTGIPIHSLTAPPLRPQIPAGAVVVIESSTDEEIAELWTLADEALISLPLLWIMPSAPPPSARDPRIVYLPPTALSPAGGVEILRGWSLWASCPGAAPPNYLCDHLPAPLARLAPDGRLVAANLALRKLLAEDDPAALADCLHPDDRARAQDAWRRLQAGESLVHFAARCRHHDGSWRAFSWSATRAPGDPPVVMIGRDVSVIIAADERIRQLEAAVEAAANGILVTDADGRIQWVNTAFCTMTGYSREEVIGQFPRLLKSGRHDAAFYEQMWATILRGRVWRGTLVNRRKDGSLYTEQMTITPLRRADGSIDRFIAIKEDVTEAETMREQLAQAARMESVSRLAGGIAHDFNNLLQTILGYLEFVAPRFPENDPGRADIETIRSAARQAADLTRRLLAFSRRQIIEPRPIQLNDVLRSLTELVRRVIGEQIVVTLQLDPQLPLVLADPGQVETVVLNLAANARDVMPQGGRLTISTRPVTFQTEDVAIYTDARAGTFACLSISDTGPGIPEEVRRHIFEPFFTAKGWGRGTGLGLATVYGIVHQHGGWIHVYSERGQGACFRIYLPTATAEAPPTTRPPPPSRPRHILVIEDEVSIARLATRVLEEAGYRVSFAQNAAAARALFEQQAQSVDLIFSDVVLPDGNGIELVDEFRRLRPDVAVLLVSGYPDDYSRWETIRERGWPFLQKPYPAADLLTEVNRVLTSAQAQGSSASNR